MEHLQAMRSLAGGWEQALRLWEEETGGLTRCCAFAVECLVIYPCPLGVFSPPLVLVGIWYHVSVLSSLKRMCI